jgi:hypothetical protein
MKNRIGYEEFPHIKEKFKNSNGLRNKLNNGYKKIFQLEDDPQRGENQRDYVAVHHFHPLVRDMVLALPNGAQHPNTLSKSLGDAIGFAHRWAWAVSGVNDREKYYLNIPTQSRTEQLECFDQIYAEHVQKRKPNTILLLNYNPTSTSISCSSSNDIQASTTSPQVATFDRLSSLNSSELDIHLSSRASGNKAISKTRGRELNEEKKLVTAENEKRMLDLDELAGMVARMNDSDKEIFQRRQKRITAELRELHQIIEECKEKVKEAEMERDELKKENAQYKIQIEEMEGELDDYIRKLNTAYNYPQGQEETCRFSKEVIRSLLITHASGLNRMTICSEEWHELNPHMCKELFGIDCTFVELKCYLTCWWPDKFSEQNSMLLVNLSLDGNMDDFSKCLMARMYQHRPWTQIALGAVFGKSSRSVRDYLDEWIPLWGELGRNLYILDITEDFLEFAAVKEFKSQGVGKTAALVDGKVFMTETIRQHNAIKQAQWSDKVHHSGVLQHIWTIQCGLIFFATELFFARCTETALVELYGQSSFKGPLKLEMSLEV